MLDCGFASALLGSSGMVSESDRVLMNKMIKKKLYKKSVKEDMVFGKLGLWFLDKTASDMIPMMQKSLISATSVDDFMLSVGCYESSFMLSPDIMVRIREELLRKTTSSEGGHRLSEAGLENSSSAMATTLFLARLNCPTVLAHSCRAELTSRVVDRLSEICRRSMAVFCNAGMLKEPLTIVHSCLMIDGRYPPEDASLCDVPMLSVYKGRSSWHRAAILSLILQNPIWNAFKHPMGKTPYSYDEYYIKNLLNGGSASDIAYGENSSLKHMLANSKGCMVVVKTWSSVGYVISGSKASFGTCVQQGSTGEHSTVLRLSISELIKGADKKVASGVIYPDNPEDTTPKCKCGWCKKVLSFEGCLVS